MSRIFEIKKHEDVDPFTLAEIFYSFVIAVVFVISIVLMVNLFLSDTFDAHENRRLKINVALVKP